MTPAEEIQSHLKSGDLPGAVQVCKAAIRKAPLEVELRFVLFQLLSLQADWEAASNQLSAYSELVGRESPMPFIFNKVVQAEVRRKYVFLGQEAPTIFGEPPEWMPYLLQALTASAEGHAAEALSLQAEALDRAPAVSGTINGQPFEWLMDGDSRLGATIEAVIDGQYYWIPQARLRSISMQPPTQVRDAIWAAASLTLENSSVIAAFIPVRYPGAQTWQDAELKLSRSTSWDSPAEGFYIGSGQRLWMSDQGEHPILETREISFNPAA